MIEAAMPRFSSCAGLDVSILDQIPQLLAAMSEIRPQPQQRRHKHCDAAGTDSHTAQYAAAPTAAWRNTTHDQLVLYVVSICHVLCTSVLSHMNISYKTLQCLHEAQGEGENEKL
jgi:hypothetical protein